MLKKFTTQHFTDKADQNLKKRQQQFYRADVAFAPSVDASMSKAFPNKLYFIHCVSCSLAFIRSSMVKMVKNGLKNNISMFQAKVSLIVKNRIRSSTRKKNKNKITGNFSPFQTEVRSRSTHHT